MEVSRRPLKLKYFVLVLVVIGFVAALSVFRFTKGDNTNGSGIVNKIPHEKVIKEKSARENTVVRESIAIKGSRTIEPPLANSPSPNVEIDSEEIPKEVLDDVEALSPEEEHIQMEILAQEESLQYEVAEDIPDLSEEEAAAQEMKALEPDEDPSEELQNELIIEQEERVIEQEESMS